MKLIEQRPQEQRSYSNTRELQQFFRETLPPDSLGPAMQEAFALAAETGLFTQPSRPQPAASKPKRGKRESPVSPRPKLTEHAERSFHFSWGETKRSCPVVGCEYGKPHRNGWRKKHSDDAVVEVEEEIDAFEVEEVKELSIEEMMSQPAVDSESGLVPDVEPDRESPNDEQLNEPQDEAESFGKDGDSEC